jgi:hypothetical protein
MRTKTDTKAQIEQSIAAAFELAARPNLSAFERQALALQFAALNEQATR